MLIPLQKKKKKKTFSKSLDHERSIQAEEKFDTKN